MTNNHLEQQLRQLGRTWQTDESFVAGVMSQVDRQPRAMVSKLTETPTRPVGYAVIAAVVACLGLWWLFGGQRTDSVLYAQVKDAMKQVQTIHEAVTVRTEAGQMRQISEVWFQRGKGFALIRDNLVRIDNGTYFWQHHRGSDTASRTRSSGSDELLDRALDIREQLNRVCERDPAGDRSIDGVPHDCYRLTGQGTAKATTSVPLNSDSQRTLIFISPESLPKRAEVLEKIDGQWQTRVVRTWEYDIPVDAQVFEPQFADSVRVIDIDEAFEQLTSVDDAVYSEERDGLIYAIHRAIRFEGGGVMILSSVRGTPETLRQYPLTRRLLQPGLYIIDGPAMNSQASPQGPGYLRLRLADANHHGVDAQWWMMVPRGRRPDWFEDQDENVRLRVSVTPQGEYAKARHADNHNVIHHITWDLPLDIPTPDRLPMLEDVAAQAHADLSLLKALTFPGKLYLGIDNVGTELTQRTGSPDDVSAKQFATAVRQHWQWWQQNDVDFQLKSGSTTYGNTIGATVMKPAVMVDYLSVVDDSTLAKAAKRSNLVVLSARETRITDAGLAHLTSLSKLRKLNIADTSVTDAGLRHVESITSLEMLNVTNTKVTPAGIDRLKTARPDLKLVTVSDDADTNSSAKATVSVNELLPSTVTGTVIDAADQPVANATVTVRIRRFAKDTDERSSKPISWTAVTDDSGRYSLSPSGTVRSKDEVRMTVVADGYADTHAEDYEKAILNGVIPPVCMLPGRPISGRLTDAAGSAVARAVVRFHSSGADTTAMWDSGPLSVDDDGRFSLSIPSDGKTVGVVYPSGSAPRFIDVADKSDQGDVVLQTGISRKGRVVDKNGSGVANTVVAIQNTNHRDLHLLTVVLATAVKTDAEGWFQLPALQGTYELAVTRSAPVYSRRMVLNGTTPPAIEPVTIEFDSAGPRDDILLREQVP